MYSAIHQYRRRVIFWLIVRLTLRDGKYGLLLDDVFENGVSSRCPAFGNEPLSESGNKFKIHAVEVWRVGGSATPAEFIYDVVSMA